MVMHYDGFVAITDEEYSQLKRAEAERDAMRDLLIWLNRQGGLGYEAHDRICAALNPSPAGNK